MAPQAVKKEKKKKKEKAKAAVESTEEPGTGVCAGGPGPGFLRGEGIAYCPVGKMGWAQVS